MLDYNSYEQLLDKKEVKGELSKKATLEGLDLSAMWSSCDDSAFYYGKMNDMTDQQIGAAKFLICADYVTAVPYGSVGYKALEEKLAKDNKTVAQARFDKFAKVMGDDMASLSQEDVASIKEFFENYNRQDIDLANMNDVTTLLCRIYHECEANYKKSGYKTESVILDRLSDFVSDFTDMHFDKDKITADEILKVIPKPEKLTESEVTFAENSLGLGTPQSVKEP